ncbi:MAG: cyclic nucleotide-binding domain-containing protein [Alphaproteobacteria bacterium]|nr:cyclic nucleotide-binding domain-containing protein [Alphaproteobacteria bacterium]
MSADGGFLEDTRSWLLTRRRGQVIFDAGEPAGLMYRVESGCVRLQINNPDGERQIVVFLFPGDLFGYEITDRVCSAEAVSDSTLRCWPVQAFLKSPQEQPRVTIQLLEAAQRRFGEMAEHIDKITHLPAKERVLWFLNGLLTCPGLPREGGRIHLPMTRLDIADYLGVAPETLSRILAGLEEDGYLRRDGRRDLELSPEGFPNARSEASLKLKTAHR